jgi:hypothetical protein
MISARPLYWLVGRGGSSGSGCVGDGIVDWLAIASILNKCRNVGKMTAL